MAKESEQSKVPVDSLGGEPGKTGKESSTAASEDTSWIEDLTDEYEGKAFGFVGGVRKPKSTA
jgi:hypothetical protein